MKIFKFGGASIKDADGIKNVYKVLQTVGYQDVLLVVSAIGKTTNALELVEQEIPDTETRKQIVNFIRSSQDGIVKGI